MFEEDNLRIKEEKDKLLVEKIVIKEIVTKALLSMLGLVQKEEDSLEIQVGKLVEAI
jgi:hypothetical protein